MSEAAILPTLPANATKRNKTAPRVKGQKKSHKNALLQKLIGQVKFQGDYSLIIRASTSFLSYKITSFCSFQTWT